MSVESRHHPGHLPNNLDMAGLGSRVKFIVPVSQPEPCTLFHLGLVDLNAQAARQSLLNILRVTIELLRQVGFLTSGSLLGVTPQSSLLKEVALRIVTRWHHGGVGGTRDRVFEFSTDHL